MCSSVCRAAYRSMMVMIGAMRAPAHAALVASAPRRQASLLEFHLDCGCDVMALERRWPSLGLVPVLVIVPVIALVGMPGANGCDAESSVFMGAAGLIGVGEEDVGQRMGEYRRSFEVGDWGLAWIGLLSGQMQVNSSIHHSDAVLLANAVGGGKRTAGRESHAWLWTGRPWKH